jgi:hypothetical protein
VKFILMTSVSVNRPDHLDTRRGRFDRTVLALLRGVVPPAKDNQRAADVLALQIGPRHASIEWVVIRPDSLQEGAASPYVLHEGLVSSMFAPGRTHMANIGRFIATLVTDAQLWSTWRGKLPVILDAATPPA